MPLRLYNTLGGAKEVFEPLVPDTVTMYVCGPTVYNLAHIGNARPVVVFDVLFRLLQTQYGTVTYARGELRALARAAPPQHHVTWMFGEVGQRRGFLRHWWQPIWRVTKSASP